VRPDICFDAQAAAVETAAIASNAPNFRAFLTPAER
jgi:hypothetical protein